MPLFQASPTFLLNASEKEKTRYGTFMWGAFYLGYFVFCLNWLIFSNLEKVGSDTAGWGNTIAKDMNDLARDAVNYSITFARGMATIITAWLMVKLTHKWAAMFAFTLNTAAMPLIFSPNFYYLVAGRMLMATGGTMLIILIQPVISRFFGLKQKGVLSSITPTAYLFAALVANVLFIYEGSSQAITKAILNQWKPISIACAALSYLPLLGYIFAKNFPTADSLSEAVDQKERPENTYAGIIKEKSCWFWIFFYSFLLVASLLVSIKVPVLIKTLNKNIVEETFKNVNLNWSRLYTTIFYVGCLCGMIWGRWAKLDYRRKPVIAFCCFMGLIFWTLIFGMTCLQNRQAVSTAVIFASVFLFAFFAMGIQSVILYVPHEYAENKNAKRLTIFYAYLWGVGYVIFTVYQIIVMSFVNVATAWASYAGMGLITFFVFLFAIFALTIKEPRPEYKFCPGLANASDLWRRKPKTETLIYR